MGTAIKASILFPASETLPLSPDLAPQQNFNLCGTMDVPSGKRGFWSQCRAFFGPAVLVSVGYMDPGNWGTDLQGGAQYRYALLSVVAMASIMAIVLQVLAARLGIVTQKNLAECCRDWMPRWTRIPNWIFCELAIGACDLSEVLGSALAINLLFHIPLLWAVFITGADVLLLIGAQNMGIRRLEAIVALLVCTIAICYAIEIFVLPQTHPAIGAIGAGLVNVRFREAGMLYVAIGIIGATVMPHNLYLHSSLVQSRKIERHDKSIREALRFNCFDSVLALSVAFVVNAAIMILAANVFFGRSGAWRSDHQWINFGANCDWIQVAFLTMAPLLGTVLASTLFGVALLASGQSSTITGTLAGQIVMEGFLNWRVAPWARRILTRLMAILPAVFFIGVHGAGSLTDLLTMSQVVLALQLPFAMFPLLYFSCSKKYMGKWNGGRALAIAGWSCALAITAMDLYGLPDLMHSLWRMLH